jgi:aryl-alcohol dehydrogenase-like predicted oxidoreductase
VFLQGLFFLGAGTLPGKMAFAVPTLEKLERIAKDTGLSLPEFALAYVSMKSRSAKLVIGTNSALEFAGILKMRGKLFSAELPTIESLENDLTSIREDQDARTASPALWPKS